MTTQKRAIELLKETKGLVYVHSFENEKRYSTYGGLDIVKAFMEIQYHLSEGRQIILTDEEGEKRMMSYEINNKCRVPYLVAKAYSKRFF